MTAMLRTFSECVIVLNEYIIVRIDYSTRKID